MTDRRLHSPPRYPRQGDRRPLDRRANPGRTAPIPAPGHPLGSPAPTSTRVSSTLLRRSSADDYSAIESDPACSRSRAGVGPVAAGGVLGSTFAPAGFGLLSQGLVARDVSADFGTASAGLGAVVLAGEMGAGRGRALPASSTRLRPARPSAAASPALSRADALSSAEPAPPVATVVSRSPVSEVSRPAVKLSFACSRVALASMMFVPHRDRTGWLGQCDVGSRADRGGSGGCGVVTLGRASRRFARA